MRNLTVLVVILQNKPERVIHNSKINVCVGVVSLHPLYLKKIANDNRITYR